MDATVADKKLRGFVRFLRDRLTAIQMDDRICGKMVRRRRNGYGPLVWERYYGGVDDAGCATATTRGLDSVARIARITSRRQGAFAARAAAASTTPSSYPFD